MYYHVAAFVMPFILIYEDGGMVIVRPLLCIKYKANGFI